MALTHSQAASYYNRIGAMQDTQAFYEDAATNLMLARADFESAAGVFEFGCGTGRFASRLLSKYLNSSASYLGIDVSRTMVKLAETRVAPFGKRANIVLTDGSICFPVANRSVDRVVAIYVFDLLSETDIQRAISESARILSPGGKLCLVSLTSGVTYISKIISSVWSLIYRMHAPLVGGCRPIHPGRYLEQHDWSIDYRTVITSWGIPSEVSISSPTDIPG